MSDAAVEEVSALSSIYCGEGEFKLLQESGSMAAPFQDRESNRESSLQHKYWSNLTATVTTDGLVLQINSTVGGERRLDVSLLFHLHPDYPSCSPDISVSSAALSRTQCQGIRQKLLDQAAALPPEPMVHQLVEWLQCVEVAEECKGGEREEEEEEEEWTAVLSLDHMRSRNRYIGLLERWSQQLQLTGRLLLGPNILVILQGARASIKEFCRLLKTVKVDVDSSGKKCKERMMKVLIETPSSSSFGRGVLGFAVVSYQSVPELTAAFQEINMTELCQIILPSLSD